MLQKKIRNKKRDYHHNHHYIAHPSSLPYFSFVFMYVTYPDRACYSPRAFKAADRRILRLPTVKRLEGYIIRLSLFLWDKISRENHLFRIVF